MTKNIFENKIFMENNAIYYACFKFNNTYKLKNIVDYQRYFDHLLGNLSSALSNGRSNILPTLSIDMHQQKISERQFTGFICFEKEYDSLFSSQALKLEPKKLDYSLWNVPMTFTINPDLLQRTQDSHLQYVSSHKYIATHILTKIDSTHDLHETGFFKSKAYEVMFNIPTPQETIKTDFSDLFD